MQVQDLMNKTLVSCSASDTLNDCARLMWEHDCGALPVVSQDGHLAGMITDRDVCMAAYTKGCALRDLRVVDAMAAEVITCTPSQDVVQAEMAMAEGCVRRAPVVDDERKLVGMVTLCDIARSASHPQALKRGLSSERVVQTLAAISAPRTRQAAHA